MSFPADTKTEAGPPAYDTPTFPTDPVGLPDEDRRRCRRKRRFFHITALSLVGLWVFGFFGPASDIADSFFKDPSDNIDDHPHPHPHYHIPPDVELHECVNWEEGKGEFPHFATGNLTLDSASDLVFISRGSFSSGRFDLTQSKDHNEGKVGVQLSAGYGHPRFLEFSKVCTITKGDSQGVGIFTPEWRRHHRCGGHRAHEPEFNISVVLPAGKKDVLAVKSLVADLPVFKQDVSALGDTVYFDKLRMMAINSAIDVKSATGDDIVIATVNAPISGSFKTDKSLELKTVNGQVTASVILNHPGDAAHVTNSFFGSTNGAIKVEAKLQASGKNEDAKLSLYAHSVKGNIDVDVQESPLDARATIEAETTTGNIHVDMPPTFEGEFNLETFVGKEVVNAPEVEDPSGRGRKREVTISHPNWKTVEGSVLWSEKGREIGGSVLLKSATGSLALQL